MVNAQASSNVQKTELANGVRVLTESVPYVKSISVGLWCRTGSRHERADEAGITHLIEHMLFKGTPTRTAKQIAEAIEGRGGSLNAFTDKEATCYYCRCLAEDLELAVDVLSDMMRDSLIDPEELAREEGVVIEEIKRDLDEPADHVHELHIQGRWGDHPLGKPVIGTIESVGGFKRENLVGYMKRRYVGSHVLLAVAGNCDPAQVRSLAEQHLGSLPSGSDDQPLSRPLGKGGENLSPKDVEQVHFCIGGDGPSLFDKDLYTGVILDNAVGGGMSSRLFQEIRERRGLAYAIGSYVLSYTAGGAYTVYGGTSLESWPIVRNLVRKEFDSVLKSGLDEAELERTKKNLAGSIVLALESMSGRMMRMSRNEMNYERDIPIEETLAKIEAVSNQDVIDLAQRILPAESVSVTAIGPFESA